MCYAAPAQNAFPAVQVLVLNIIIGTLFVRVSLAC